MSGGLLGSRVIFYPSFSAHSGSEDIFNGNLKLILGLIWTLIRRYQIRSTGRALSTKDSLLAWVNTQIPEQKIKNFTKDWNSGIALCALVNRIGSGVIPHYATLSPSDRTKNCALGMDHAEEKLGIPKIMEPNDLCHPDIDELSVMTYISYFCTPANDHLLKWVQATIPDRGITNFTTDWNDGTNLACLLEALNPGGFPDSRELDPHNSLDNLTKGMKLADEQLAIKPVIKPNEMADPKVDELNIVTYLSRFQNAKPLQAIFCSGEGLESAIVGKTAVFEVDTSKGGSGDLAVKIHCSGKPVVANITQKSNKTEYVIEYVPESASNISIAIEWSGEEIPTSPYSITVLDPKSFSLTGPQISGNEYAKVGDVVKMELKGMTQISDVRVSIELSSGQTEQAKIISSSKTTAECSYVPRRVGIDKVVASIAGITIPGSPFKVRIIDPKEFSVTLRDPPRGKPVLVNNKATIAISAAKGEVLSVMAELFSPKGTQEIMLKSQGDGSCIGVITPISVGKHDIKVTCAGESVKGSPISLQVSDPSKCTFLDTLPKYLQVGKPQSIDLSVKDAGEGTIQTKSSEVGILSVESEDASTKDKRRIQLTPKKVGESTVCVDWNGVAVAHTPHKISVCDATKCSAFGPGLTSGKGKIKEAFEFQVQVKGSGNGELNVTPRGPKSVYAADIKKKSDGTYKVSFVTFEVGDHSIEITWSGENIPNSPYKINFVKAAEAKLFSVTGDGLKKSIALELSKCVIVGPEDSLVSSGILKVDVSGSGYKSAIVGLGVFDPKNPSVCISDDGNGIYSVQYSVPKAGKYSLSITSDGENVPGSPFQVTALPAPDASKCKAFGAIIDNPTGLTTIKPLEFKVDSSEAGTGELSVTAKDQNASNIPVFLSEDKSKGGKKIHSIKIDPKQKGKYEVSVEWSGKHIPKSPFIFDVGDPQKVIIIDLPDSAEFVGRKGEPMFFSVDTRQAGAGEIKAAAKLNRNKVEIYGQENNPDGTIKLSYLPKAEGPLELLLTFSGVSILSSPWIVHVADPSSFEVIPPKDSGKWKEYVKFVIAGLNKKQTKDISISAKNKTHDATVKIEFNEQGQAVARFTAKELGTYNVEVKAAKRHITGSPFSCQVVNPEGCIIRGDVPTIIPIRTEKQFTVDTSKAGPGVLEYVCSGGDSPNISSTISGLENKVVKIKGLKCGKATYDLKYSGYSIPSMPVDIICSDPYKCTVSCKQIESNTCKTDESITVSIDTTNGGHCYPEVIAKGPKSNYDIEVKKLMEGKYEAIFVPWQDGNNTILVTVGGENVSKSPLKFEALKPLDASKITVRGHGLSGAVANRRAEVTVYARESKLVDKGLLGVAFKDALGADCDLKIKDKQDGTYAVSFTPKATGTMQLSVTGEGLDIVGSPFNINVMPEPDASKCKLQGNSGNEVFTSSSEMYHLAKTQYMLSVLTTNAGTGTLSVEGTSPKGDPIRIFTKEEKVKGEKVSFIKFDPTSVGAYTLSISWDEQKLIGSPYLIKVIDPSRCSSSGPFPSYVKIDDKVEYEINTSTGGDGEITVVTDDPCVKANVTKGDDSTYIITCSGKKMGSASVDVKFGDFNLPSSPYNISVLNPNNVTTDFKSRIYNVGKQIKFTADATNAGKAELKAVTSSQSTSLVRNTKGSKWDLTLTPKDIGEYQLQIFWGDWEIKDSPFSFSVGDSSKVKVMGLPNPNDILTMGETVSFSVDCSEAGPGDYTCHTVASDGKIVEMEKEETDADSGISSLYFVPKTPGKVKIVLEFNGIDIFTRPHVYDVPDPSQFKVTPPKGYSKIYEDVKFGITGVKEEIELSITAVHPEEEAKIKTNRGSDRTVFAQFLPTHTGTYTVEVKHAGRHIDGSPLEVPVCNPESCKFIGNVPSVFYINEKPEIQVNQSEAGPGELTFEVEVLSGSKDVLGGSSNWDLSTITKVCKLRVFAKWGGHNIPASPFILNFIDSGKVKWSCEELEESGNNIKQGELIKIQIDGSEGGETTPTVIATGGAKSEEYPGKIVNNHDGTFTVSLNPWHIGKNEIQILWGSSSIPDTPISFKVTKNLEALAITASGSGLKQAFIDIETSVVINAIESGLVKQGLLDAAFECDEDEDEEDIPLIEITDEGEGMYNLSLFPVTEGTFVLHIIYDDQHISNSPFTIEVLGAPDSGKCKVFGEAIERKPAFFALNKPIDFSIDTSEAGSGSINISALQPNGDSVKVYTLNEDDLYHLKIDPAEVGHYQVKVKWDGEAIPGSPFDFNVVDPRMCKVEGLPQSDDILQLDETINFSVLTEEVDECTPVVSFGIQGEKLDVLEPTEQSDGVFSYNFMLLSYGKVLVYIKIAGINIPNSPFSFTVLDPHRFSIVAVDRGKYALVSEPVNIKISGSGSSSELLVTAHGPSADLNLEVKEKDTGHYEANFIPIEPGSYEVFVECAGRHVYGSPFTVKVADPSKVELLGGGLSSIQLGESGEIAVKTRGAGEGTLEASVVTDYDSDVSIFTEIKDLGLDTYTLILVGKKIGSGKIHLKWAGFPVPNTPFLIHICDASRCIASGEALTSKKGKAGKLILFTVDTEYAGEGKLEVTAKGPSAQYTMNVEKNESSKYNVSFTPWEIGEHMIEVQWGGGDIPGSPFLVNVGTPLEMEICNATGDGLNHGIANKKATFTIICSEVGLLDKDTLKVTVKGVSTQADVTLTDNNNGCYTADYIPPIPGAYLATILYYERHIPGSPFKVTVDSGPDATKCKAYGPALHPNALAIAGSLLEFFVDTSEAGYGNLKVYIKGPNDYKPRVFMADDNKGVYSVKFDAMKAGKYFVVVVWAESHIPNSPFRLKVHPAADASKVRAFGPGLLDGFIGTPGQFTIETKNAGIGTLLLRIHGLKNSFKVEAIPLVSEDPRTLITTYNPKLVGEYVLFIRWSGVHVPGSPFTVKIKQKPGELYS